VKSWITGLVAAFLVFGAPGARADPGAPSGVTQLRNSEA
jgi:hypothetical protein